jgi:hypothetical protein
VYVRSDSNRIRCVCEHVLYKISEMEMMWRLLNLNRAKFNEQYGKDVYDRWATYATERFERIARRTANDTYQFSLAPEEFIPVSCYGLDGKLWRSKS